MAERLDLSPAEAYVAAKRRASYPQLTEFAAQMAFEFDEFQRRGCEALEDGHGVLVCAPTGAGKTVVGEFAVHLALAEGRRCFYTTPIKALSNQKYADLTAWYGEGSVGLLTGDTAINSTAPVVVMTTEVLRNMLYAGSSAINELSYVVMDEIHYLADRFRGAVWEEVILHLPEHVRVAGLSATVSNAEEFGEWLVEVRGDTAVVVDEHRPVPLWQHMMVGKQMFDLFAADGEGRARINPTLVKRTEEARAALGPAGLRGQRNQRGRGKGPPSRGGRGPKFRPPSRMDVIQRLDTEGLLPAIVFIFSRAGCDAAVEQCSRADIRLNGPEEVEQVRAIVDARTADLPERDLGVLGYWEWRDALERGIAAHHAGLLPAFKETVEELFVRGLVKVVFATETLALGINMPARTVVLERLVKYNGEAHVDLTPGEYTQLTGRAGRRGIDVEGYAVVLWQPGVDPKHVAGLASTRTYPLHSSFRPGYNMAVNLVGQVGVEQARELLEQSFAQFQADRSVVGLSRKIDRNKEALAGYAEAAGEDFAQLREYVELRRKISDREKTLARKRKYARQDEVADSLERLRKGDVISIPNGKRAGLAVVIDPGTDPAREPRPVVVTEDRWSGPLSVADFPTPVSSLGRVRLPKHVDVRSPRVRRDIASSLRNTGIAAPGKKRGKADAHSDPELSRLRDELRAHPAHGLADRESRVRWVERYERLEQENNKLERKVAARTHSLARSFDKIRALLTERGYLVDGESGDGSGGGRVTRVTEHGYRLARIYSESDLLTAECIRRDVWRGLGPAELAAVVSTLVYEARRDSAGEPKVPSGGVAEAWEHTARVWSELAEDERRHKLERTREPDAGFAWPVYRWARGESLEKVMTASESAGQELSAGDFVRWCRQVVDLLEQLRDVLGNSDEIGNAAGDAVRAIRRGVVAAGAT
ncbi:DEAD/DEAH box helicase [Haloechinothrix alba]|uniref:DEAD/DEAH box helicase n=1 Tax=Haloechinothrix alba TaxID=664784 RepID=UPI001FE66A8E|nr:DEAD/DEAH box helicase [Haloechinothrix alba]